MTFALYLKLCKTEWGVRRVELQDVDQHQPDAVNIVLLCTFAVYSRVVMRPVSTEKDST